MSFEFGFVPVDLYTFSSSWAGAGLPLDQHSYDRVLAMQVSGEPAVETTIDYPSGPDVDHRSEQMGPDSALRMQAYLQRSARTPGVEPGGTDHTFSFAFWMRDGGELLDAESSRDQAQFIVRRGIRAASRLAVGQVGVIGLPPSKRYPEGLAQSAFVALGLHSNDCLRGQDGHVGIMSYDRAMGNQKARTAYNHRQGSKMDKKLAEQLAVFL